LFTADLRPQFDEVNKCISLSPQLVGDHWRLAFDRGYHGDVDPAALQGFDQGTKIAIARNKMI
jgi:hypothetical protein